MNDFYLTLPSNSSTRYFKDNTLTKYTTKLHTTIDLTGDWQMALSEIVFPHNWMTLDRVESVFTVTSNGWDIQDVGKGPVFTTEIRIPHGYYESVHDIVREMNKALRNVIPVVIFIDPHVPQKDENHMPRVKYNEASKRVHFTMYRNQSIAFHPSLATILGVSSKQNPSKAKDEDVYNWTATNISDITKGINYVMVYCDLLEHVPVGDTMAPLLRVVNATGANGEIIHHVYDVPRYIPIQKKNFDTIEVDIRTDTGEPVLFETGKLMLTVHFKRADSKYFA